MPSSSWACLITVGPLLLLRGLVGVLIVGLLAVLGGLGLITILRWRLVPVLRWRGTSLVLLMRRGVLLLLLWRILHKSFPRSALQAATALLRSSSEAGQADPAVAWLNGRSMVRQGQSDREVSRQAIFSRQLLSRLLMLQALHSIMRGLATASLLHSHVWQGLTCGRSCCGGGGPPWWG